MVQWDSSTDSELIDTGFANGRGSNADEGEANGCGGICLHPLTGTDSSWAVNEGFCQDGITSYEFGHGVECHQHAIGYIYPRVCGANGACATVQEVHTVTNNGDYVSYQGDSGGVVFTVAASGGRNAAGLVSTGYNCSMVTSDVAACAEMGFVFAPTLYKAYFVHLNPHT